MPDKLGKLLPAAVFVLADDAGNLEKAHLLYQKHLQKPVRGVGLRHGMEAAAVILSVAYAHEGLLTVDSLSAHFHHIVGGNAPEEIDDRGGGVGVEALQKGQTLIPGHIRADPGIQSYGTDVQSQILIAANQVKGRLLRVQEPGKIGKSGAFRENPHEIVAASSGKGGDRRIGKARRAGGHFVQGAVAAAGVKPQGFPGFRRRPGNLAALTRRLGDPDFVVQPGAVGFNLSAIPVGPVVAACRGIDDEQVLHRAPPILYFFCLPPKYI